VPEHCPGTDCPLAWHCKHAQTFPGEAQLLLPLYTGGGCINYQTSGITTQSWPEPTLKAPWKEESERMPRVFF